MANNLAPTWEVIPSVARSLNFSLTVRDNKAGGGQTSDDLMLVTVNGTAGPFTVSAPNTAVSWSVGSSQTVTWNVASTNVAPVNCLNVNILLSTDGGFTYPITLLSNTPNDGSQAITVPNNVAATCRVKVEAADNIFYDISNVNFTITNGTTCTATVPTGLAASGITATGATLNWNVVAGATYDVQYRQTGTTTWTTVATSSNSTTLSGLTAATQYEAQVRSKCTSTTSAYSASVTFTTTSTCSATVPTGLAASGITSTGATLNWNAVTGATYDVQYRQTGTTTWAVLAVSTNSTTLSALTAATQYEAQVRSKCGTTTSAYSASLTFTTTTTTITYCASKGNSVADEYISRVQVGTINNASGANAGYGNFTSLSTDLSKSTAYALTVTPTWTGTKYNEGYSAWIDYNKDGDFTDAGEQIFSKAASQTTPVSGTFTVPATAIAGSTRLRVSMKYNGIPTSCETFSYGEVEDYTVNITTGGGPTCTDATLTLKLDNYPEETSWTIKNASGTTVASGGTYGSSPDGSTITATHCLPAGCYTFTINDSYGDGICCTYGNGSYTLKDAAGTTLASGATFTSSATHNFCVGGAAKDARGVEYTEFSTEEVRRSVVYPNPVKDQLKIRLKPGAEIRTVRIATTSGLYIAAPMQGDKEIDVSSLKSGMYVLTVDTSKGQIIEKFIKE